MRFSYFKRFYPGVLNLAVTQFFKIPLGVPSSSQFLKFNCFSSVNGNRFWIIKLAITLVSCFLMKH